MFFYNFKLFGNLWKTLLFQAQFFLDKTFPGRLNPDGTYEVNAKADDKRRTKRYDKNR